MFGLLQGPFSQSTTEAERRELLRKLLSKEFVNLTEELVNLIIAQRNFQANAKTIETLDAVTQTIINIR